MKEALAAIEAAGVKLGLATPALFGGILALYFYDEQPGETRRGRKLLVVLGGAGLGYFLAPLVVEGFGLVDSKGRLEVGFAVLIAVGGMSVLAAILRAVRSTDLGKALESWITRR